MADEDPDKIIEENTEQLKDNTEAMQAFYQSLRSSDKQREKNAQRFREQTKQAQQQASESNQRTEENARRFYKAAEQASHDAQDAYGDMWDDYQAETEKLKEKLHEFNENISELNENLEQPKAAHFTHNEATAGAGFTMSDGDPAAFTTQAQYDHTVKETQYQHRRDRTLDERWEDYIEFLSCKFDDLNKQLKEVTNAVDQDGGGGFFGAFGGGGKGSGGGRGGRFGRLGGMLSRGLGFISKVALPLAVMQSVNSAFGFLGPSTQERKDSGESFFNRENNNTLFGSLLNSRFGDYTKYAVTGAGIGSFIPGIGTIAGAGIGVGAAALLENWTDIKSFFTSMKDWSVEATTDEIVKQIKGFSFSKDVSQPLGEFLGGVKTDVLDPTLNYFKDTTVSGIVQDTKDLIMQVPLVPGLVSTINALSGAAGRISSALWAKAKQEIGENLDNYPETKAFLLRLGEQAESYVTNLGERASSISEKVRNFAIGLWDRATGAEQQDPADLGGTGYSEAQIVYGSIKAKADQLLTNVRDFAQDAWDWTPPGSEQTAGEMASNAYYYAKNQAKMILAQAKSLVQDAWDWTPPGSEQPIVQTASEAYEQTKAKAGQVIGVVFSKVIGFWDSLATKVVGFAAETFGLDISYEQIKDKVKKFVTGLADSIDSWTERNLGFKVFGSQESGPITPTPNPHAGMDASPVVVRAQPTLQQIRTNQRKANRHGRNKATGSYNERRDPQLIEDLPKKDPRETTEKQRGKIHTLKGGVQTPRNPAAPNINNTPLIPDDRGLALFDVYDF